jgi:Flp pilus assembly protein TadG
MYRGFFRKLFHNLKKGQSYIEFVLVLPILLLLVGGLIETALLMRAQLVLTNATREAARLASRGRADAEAARQGMFAFSNQLPAQTDPPDTANTGIIITRFTVPAVMDGSVITETVYYSGTATLGASGGCPSRVPADEWNILAAQNQGYGTTHEVAIVEMCHNYRLALLPVGRALYDQTTMRIAALRSQ